MKKLYGLLFSLLLTSAVFASDLYIVEAETFDNRILIAAPVLTVAANEDISISEKGAYTYLLN